MAPDVEWIKQLNIDKPITHKSSIMDIAKSSTAGDED